MRRSLAAGPLLVALSCVPAAESPPDEAAVYSGSVREEGASE